MKIPFCLICLTAVGILAGSGAEPAGNENALPGRKKIIQCGWDQRTPEQLAGVYPELEKRLPFDGLILTFKARDAKGKVIGNSARLWERGKWEQNAFAQDTETLRKCGFTKFKHNYLLTGATGNKSEIADWFDDRYWEDIASHFGLAAEAARESGCKGLVFDAETYSKFRWSYRPDSGKSFEETAGKARMRGRQVMKAIKAEYPDAVILFYWFLSMSGLSQPENFPKIGYGLYPSFINGFLDELSPRMILVDGVENGYWYKNKGSYLNTYQKIRSASNPAIAPENREKYRLQVRAGFGLYLDSHIIRSGYSVPPIKGSQVRAFRNQLTNALEASDQYVWLYGERRTWYSDDESRTWEGTFPGMIRAIELSRNPEKIVDEIPGALAGGKLKNLARNPEFEEQPGQNDAWYHSDFSVSRIHGFAQYGKGTAAVDRTDGFKSPTSAMLSGPVSLIQSVNVSEGESYYISVRAKSSGKRAPKLSVGWQTAQSVWCDQDCGRSRFPSGGSAQDWQALSIFTQVPAGAGKLVVMLSASSGSPDDRVWFDKLEICQLDDLYEPPNTYQTMMQAIRRQNKARNGEFSSPAAAGKILPVKKFPGYWVWSEKQPTPGIYAIDGTSGYRSGSSAKLTGMVKRASICQYIPVKPGEKYRARIFARKKGNGKLSFSVSWMNRYKWTAGKFAKRAEFKAVSGTEWLMAEIDSITVPDGVNQLIPVASVSGQSGPDDAAWFDRLEVSLTE